MNPKPSGRVGDYEKFIPEIINRLKTERPEQVNAIMCTIFTVPKRKKPMKNGSAKCLMK